MNRNAPQEVYLGIDSAGSHLALALWSPEQGTLASVCDVVGRDHAKRIVLELEALFKGAGLSREQVRGIGVGLGPGSYTGLRVGIATAKGLARGLGVPLGGSSSLAAMAYGVLADGEQGIISLDARRGNVYAGIFQKTDRRVTLTGELAKLPRAILRSSHPQLSYYEHLPPDAGYLARQAYEAPRRAVAPLYL